MPPLAQIPRGSLRCSEGVVFGPGITARSTTRASEDGRRRESGDRQRVAEMPSRADLATSGTRDPGRDAQSARRARSQGCGAFRAYGRGSLRACETSAQADRRGPRPPVGEPDVAASEVPPTTVTRGVGWTHDGGRGWWAPRVRQRCVFVATPSDGSARVRVTQKGPA